MRGFLENSTAGVILVETFYKKKGMVHQPCLEMDTKKKNIWLKIIRLVNQLDG